MGLHLAALILAIWMTVACLTALVRIWRSRIYRVVFTPAEQTLKQILAAETDEPVPTSELRHRHWSITLFRWSLVTSIFFAALVLLVLIVTIGDRLGAY